MDSNSFKLRLKNTIDSVFQSPSNKSEFSNTFGISTPIRNRDEIKIEYEDINSQTLRNITKSKELSRGRIPYSFNKSFSNVYSPIEAKTLKNEALVYV